MCAIARISADLYLPFLTLQNGLGIEHGLYEATRKIDATILSSVCHISTKSVIVSWPLQMACVAESLTCPA